MKYVSFEKIEKVIDKRFRILFIGVGMAVGGYPLLEPFGGSYFLDTSKVIFRKPIYWF